jgi:hypothetical protein
MLTLPVQDGHSCLSLLDVVLDGCSAVSGIDQTENEKSKEQEKGRAV